MVSRIHCDICEEYELPTVHRKYQVGYLPVEADPNRGPVYAEFDLCFECETMVLRFMLHDHLTNDIDFQNRLVKVIRGKVNMGKEK